MECQLKDISVYYEMMGEGEPIIMLHGMPLDHHHMMAEMEPLFTHRPGWKRIYVDLPGMGKTPGPDWITSQDQILDVLTAFIDQIIPGERFCVAGLSYGGYVARGLIYCRAALIDGVLMTVPAIIMDGKRRNCPSLRVIHKDPAVMATLDPDLRGGIEGMAVVQSQKVVDYWKAVIRPAVQAADQTFLDRTTNPCVYSFEADLSSVTLDKPSLIITGRQDNACGYKQAWDILEQLPRATFAVLDRAGHCLPSEQEPLFRALVAEWLDRVEEGIRQK